MPFRADNLYVCLIFDVNEQVQMPPKTKAAGKAKGPAKRKLAEEFPPGEVLTDTAKKSWKLGTPVGQGGFGLLYLGKSLFILQGSRET